MIPSVSTPVVTPKPAAAGAALAATRTAVPPSPESAPSSAGERAAANIRPESVKAVDAPDQTAVAPRLREQETAERTDRTEPALDKPAGPEPAFEESPLERQARLALEPSETNEAPAEDTSVQGAAATESSGSSPPVAPDEATPPPTPSERAEASLAETRTISEPHGPSVDVTR